MSAYIYIYLFIIQAPVISPIRGREMYKSATASGLYTTMAWLHVAYCIYIAAPQEAIVYYIIVFASTFYFCILFSFLRPKRYDMYNKLYISSCYIIVFAKINH